MFISSSVSASSGCPVVIKKTSLWKGVTANLKYYYSNTLLNLTSVPCVPSSILFLSSPLASFIWASKSSELSFKDTTSSAYGIRCFVLAIMRVWRRSLNWIWKSPNCCASHSPWVVLPDPLAPSRMIRMAGGLGRRRQECDFCTSNSCMTFSFSCNIRLYLKRLSLCNIFGRVLKEGVPGFLAGEEKSLLPVPGSDFFLAGPQDVMVF